MAEQAMITRCGRVPHHGPASPDCPVGWLLTVLWPGSFNPLARVCGAPSGEPRTAGDVPDLHARREIQGPGPHRVPKIEAALVPVGLYLTGHQQRPASGKEPGRGPCRRECS